MERAAVVLADSGVAVVGSRGSLTEPSPGLALIDGDDLLVGKDARRSARLKPRWVHSRFWHMLGTDPLGRPFPHDLRTADLAYEHLSEVWRSAGRDAQEVILVVPGVYTNEQLALLLGIARAAHIPVRGLVDLGVAAAADRAIRRRCFHLDLHLHRVVLTEVEHGQAIVRGRVWENDGVGLVKLNDLWARTVARLFVRQTRFDPLHHAGSEQNLYLELPRAIEALTELETTRITVASGGGEHGIDLERRDMVAVSSDAIHTVSSWLEQVADLGGATLLVSDLAASVPGLVDRLRELPDSEITVLHPAAPGSGALNHADGIITFDDALPLVIRLPGYDARPPGPVTVAVTPPLGIEPDGVGPTHVVIDGVARLITEQPIAIPVENIDQSAASKAAQQVPATVRRIGSTVVVEAPPDVAVTINGEVAESSSVLTTGDRLRLGDSPGEVILVTMER